MKLFKKACAFFQLLSEIFKWIRFVLFIQRLKTAIQQAVVKIPDFKEGAIQFLFVPKCKASDRMMFGIGLGCERKFIFAARQGFSHTRPAGYRGTNKDECDCSGDAAAKIQGAAYAYKNDYGYRSSDMPASCIIPGRDNSPGAVCYAIFDGDNREYMRLYIGVSGAYGEENETCATAAAPIIRAWCNRNGKIVYR